MYCIIFVKWPPNTGIMNGISDNYIRCSYHHPLWMKQVWFEVSVIVSRSVTQYWSIFKHLSWSLELQATVLRDLSGRWRLWFSAMICWQWVTRPLSCLLKCNMTPVPVHSADPVTSDPTCQVILMPPWPAMKPENTVGERKRACIKQLNPGIIKRFCFFAS